jgi:hypothetical protein
LTEKTPVVRPHPFLDKPALIVVVSNGESLRGPSDPPISVVCDESRTVTAPYEAVFSPMANHLFAALPKAEYARWLPNLEPVELTLAQVLYESGGELEHVNFPTTAIVSLLYVMGDGASAEIAVVGNEGWLEFRFSWAECPRPVVRLFKAPVWGSVWLRKS